MTSMSLAAGTKTKTTTQQHHKQQQGRSQCDPLGPQKTSVVTLMTPLVSEDKHCDPLGPQKTSIVTLMTPLVLGRQTLIVTLVALRPQALRPSWPSEDKRCDPHDPFGFGIQTL